MNFCSFAAVQNLNIISTLVDLLSKAIVQSNGLSITIGIYGFPMSLAFNGSCVGMPEAKDTFALA